MKALILAAGLGSRLAPITDTIPKALVPVNGTPILFKQIQNLVENGITDISIVAGYKASYLENTVINKWNFVKIINNTEYSTTNNMYSAYLGLNAIGVGDMLMMNADVYFDSSIINTLLQMDSSNAIVTDIGHYNEESMKVIEKNGHLIHISKAITEQDALGSSIDVYKFNMEGAVAFYNKCREYIVEKKDVKKWSEVALDDILSHIEFRACPLNGRWYEIDNLDDLKNAENLFENG